ncbi:hypothetical protein SAMN05192588_1169 [Nonlabens sp. Hel1_33_55]|uniref:DUF6146 family protein n=1 Tax=Nonlabens sp. Hel1_33_55 TaxID=1336802 RepID=UPI000875EE68|nr:DUF6146 family protein [Nonlabens sp. Hel1_33_55]SCY10385.1 hypothetical protein SAMN05192588_1169 [Nonlabens sp. Hel1_33_55]
MRSILGTICLLISIIWIASSCGSQNSTTTERSPEVINDTIRIANDSLEYEVIIIEPGFNSWLATQPPQEFRAKSSMDITNDIKIPLYNLRVNQPLQYDPNLYPFRIDYDPSIDYGLEVTYLLFNYFKFFEQRFNQRL